MVTWYSLIPYWIIVTWWFFFFGACKKIFNFRFSDSFLQTTFPQSDSSCNDASDTKLYANFPKISLFVSSNTYEKHIVCKDYCIAHHNDKLCFLPNCRYHLILIGDIDELLQKLNAFCFKYQHMDCLYTLIKHWFSGESLPWEDKCLIRCKEQFTLTKETGEWTKCPALQKRDCKEKSTKSFFWVLSRRRNQRRQLDQYLQRELNWSKSRKD